MKNHRICLVVGTRPEIIKMAPVIYECERRCLDYLLVHSGQHYSFFMNRIFFEELGIRQPCVNLNTGSGSQAEEIARILLGMEKVLEKEKPAVVLCQGDTNTVLAAAIAASRAEIVLGHVEAGLRSRDKNMPEEINRIIADRLSDLLFAPTREAGANLLQEGIDEGKVFITGNTIVDAVLANIDEGKAQQLLKRYGLKEGMYFVMTLHRQENVDNPSTMLSIIEGLRSVADEFGLPILFPAHPRTIKNLEKMGLSSTFLTIIEPIGYRDFLQLLSKSRLVMTDSGGVQEEACILRVPCVTIRTSTERPETVEVGANIVAGVSKDGILEGVEKMLSVKRNWPNPFGDGMAGKRIVKITEERLGNPRA